MSSSNQVSVTYVAESTYGVTPDPAGAITIQQVRFTSESLTGTPITEQSGTIRTDRNPSGQIITGLEVGGAINFEVARDAVNDEFFALAMMSSWQAATSDVSGVSFTLTGVDAEDGTLAGTGIAAGLSVGDVLRVTDSGTDFFFVISTITDADTLEVACEKNQADLAGATSRRPPYLDIGDTISSLTIAKAYEDVVDGSGDEYSQTYAGSVVSGFSVNFEHGSRTTGTFNTLGNGYTPEKPSYQQQVVSGGGTITPAPTSEGLNASSDVPVITLSSAANDFCIMSMDISLDNGMRPQNCIGTPPPKRYNLGDAGINVQMSVYNSATAQAALASAKETQTPIPVTIVVQNDDGGYAFAFPAVQIVYDDGASSGSNQDVMLEPSGPAKVGDSGESALRIYQL